MMERQQRELLSSHKEVEPARKPSARFFVNAEKISLLHCLLHHALESLVSANTGKGHT
jgi:hypothetical protein